MLRYAGYVYDSESGLYYCSARYYDPATRQFTTADSAKADGEESAYQYCADNPVQNTDPSGLHYNSREYSVGWYGKGGLSFDISVSWDWNGTTISDLYMAKCGLHHGGYYCIMTGRYGFGDFYRKSDRYNSSDYAGAFGELGYNWNEPWEYASAGIINFGEFHADIYIWCNGCDVERHQDSYRNTDAYWPGFVEDLLDA